MGKVMVDESRRVRRVRNSSAEGFWVRPVLWVGLLVTLLIPGCGSHPTVDFKEGFRNFKWGSGPGEQTGLVPLGVQGKLEFYQKDQEDLNFHGTVLERIVYGFFDGRLYAVFLYFAATEDFTKLEKVFKDAWGGPAQKDDRARRVFWNEELVTVLLTFEPSAGEFSSDSGVGRVSIVHKPLQAEMDAHGEGS